MKNQRLKTFYLYLIVLTSCLFFDVNAQDIKKSQSNTIKTPQAAIAELRKFYNQRDFVSGYKLGAKLVEEFPGNLELRALYIINAARSGEKATAVTLAEKFIEEKGENLWTLLALTIAQTYKNPSVALPTAEKLVKITPENEEAIFAYNSTLLQNDKSAEALAHLEKNSAVIKDKSQFYLTKAIIQHKMGTANKDSVMTKSAYQNFVKAVRANPNSVNANYLYGYYLSFDKNFDEAIPFLKKAVSLSPDVIQIRRKYWEAVKGQTRKDDFQKDEELTAAFNNWLKANPNSPEVLLIISKEYDSLGEEQKRDLYENQILRRFPATAEEEEVVFDRINRFATGVYASKRELEQSSEDTSEKTQREKDVAELQQNHLKLQKMRWDYIKRPKHFDEDKLGTVYYRLLYDVKTRPDITDDQLLEVFQGVLKYEKDNYSSLNSYIAEALIEGKDFRPKSSLNAEAEKYARLGVAEAEEKAEKHQSPSSAASLRGTAYNILGVVLTKEDKLEEAETELLKAQKLIAEKLPSSSLRNKIERNLASLYLAKKDFDKAEEYYLKGAKGEKSEEKWFRAFYEKRNGNSAGFDSYFAKIKEKIKIKLRETALATRIKEPQEALPFVLKTIDDKTISYADLKGKVIMINVWGIWCTPCIKEMPDIQRLYKKYENDETVKILTIDYDDELSKVKKFLSENKYEFPVLIDDGYVLKAYKLLVKENHGYPTTFFIDREGKVAFIKRGNTGNVFEEFDWRIEDLRK